MENLSYNVFIFNPNTNSFESYDVIPYLVEEFNKLRKKNIPTSETELTTWVNRELQYMYWSRCEYEIVLKDWPCGKVEKKIDIYQQCCLNLYLIVAVLVSVLGLEFKTAIANG